MAAILTVQAELEGQGYYSPSRPLQSVKRKGEMDDDFDQRVWKEHIHHEGGKVYIPPMALQKCVKEAAQFLGERVSGKGQATWTKHFTAGIFVAEPVYIGRTVEDAEPERLFVFANGKEGSRVWRTYPRFGKWSGVARLTLVDERLMESPDKVREYLEKAGLLIGVGRWRPRNGGLYGRFTVGNFKVL